MSELPPPPVPTDADLTAFAFMPLEVTRLKRSKAWLICKRRPELAFYMVNLWISSWHERPAGSLENDDDVLADLAMCAPSEWPALKEHVMRGWVLCSDSRFYHPIVAEKVIDAWGKKLRHEYEKTCDRERKNAKRSGVDNYSQPTFESWLSGGQEGIVQRTNGNVRRTDANNEVTVQRTSTDFPAEIALKALKGEKSKSKSLNQSLSQTRAHARTPGQDHVDHVDHQDHDDLNNKTPSRSPRSPRSQSPRNGDWATVVGHVAKALASQPVGEPVDFSALSKISGLTEPQVRAAVQQLKDGGAFPPQVSA